MENNKLIIFNTRYLSDIEAQFANLPSVLGDGLLMSTDQGRAIVHVLSDASPILRDVMTEVLNDTAHVDVRFSLNGQDSFFLVQTDQKRVQEDWDQLQRLGTMFNVTMHAGDTHVDLRLRSPALLLNIRYGGKCFHLYYFYFDCSLFRIISIFSLKINL